MARHGTEHCMRAWRARLLRGPVLDPWLAPAAQAQAQSTPGLLEVGTNTDPVRAAGWKQGFLAKFKSGL